MKIGRVLGSLMYRFIRERRTVALTNLKLAFPDITDAAREQLARESFSHLGMAVAETAWMWYRDKNDMSDMQCEGTEHMEKAIADGKGVILLQAHFTIIDTCTAIIAPHWPVSAVYDPPSNPMFASYLLYQRCRQLKTLIDNRSTRDMVRCLRRGEVVWFSPDQSVGASRGGIASEFFGQQVLTSSGTARIAKMTGATILPFIPTRHKNASAYTFQFCEPMVLDTDDITLATQQVNDVLESHVRGQPEHYLWTHRRFKPPTPQHTNPYA